MANLNVLFTTPDHIRTVIGTITLDATITEVHNIESQITSNAVEDGTTVDDNVLILPTRYEVTGEITDTPLIDFGGLVGIQERRIEAFEQFRDFVRNATILTVVSHYTVYTDMIMTSFNPAKSPGQGRKLSFSAQFQQIKKATAVDVTLTPDKIQAAQRLIAQSRARLGRKPKKTATDTIRTKVVS